MNPIPSGTHSKIEGTNNIRDACVNFEKIGEVYPVFLWISTLEKVTHDAALILDKVCHNIPFIECFNEKIIDRKNVCKELLIVAANINNIIDLAFKMLKQKPIFENTTKFKINDRCAKLQIIAEKMISESIMHDDENEVLLFLAAKSDENSTLNKIPKDLINLFATTMFELKLNDAKNDCKAI